VTEPRKLQQALSAVASEEGFEVGFSHSQKKLAEASFDRGLFMSLRLLPRIDVVSGSFVLAGAEAVVGADGPDEGTFSIERSSAAGGVLEFFIEVAIQEDEVATVLPIASVAAEGIKEFGMPIGIEEASDGGGAFVTFGFGASEEADAFFIFDGISGLKTEEDVHEGGVGFGFPVFVARDARETLVFVVEGVDGDHEVDTAVLGDRLSGACDGLGTDPEAGGGEDDNDRDHDKELNQSEALAGGGG